MFQIFIKRRPQPLPKVLLLLKKELKKKEGKQIETKKLSFEEQKLLEYIRHETHSLNLNNLTRTNAYLQFFLRQPDVHWAFLGHMVSRNGGWNMTDLKGEFLNRLLSKKEQRAFFSFLERGNWLIFQDVYPQFMIYEESIRKQKNLFYLLPFLHVSTFMETIWNYYWKEHDSNLLTVALIINEQSYLEKRVIRNHDFQKNVMNLLEFKLQDYLSLNHILFPYSKNRKTKLIGQTLHHFENLQERIRLGKRLYSILFAEEQLSHSINWAVDHRHTGSRKDYWPHIFHDVKEGIPNRLLKPRLHSCQITPGTPRIYSPGLTFTWKNVKHEPAEIHDWFTNWKVLYYFIDSKEKINGEIQNDYCKALEKLEFAAITKKVISIFE